ncbi:hypothetical protein [Mucilaginibacter gossypii]|uniref:Uncharacterized protein n=1 Tax=Mucilaginibacter gossypii TaxID=551996 RepID=A0A1G8B821_9SPHI|nr:hypothetical protein [Mucilaginibacter gossypii]SDH29318.1 hypothetical protein SAMN05192573_108129 [Mucilaginibacter gossypii]
MDETSLATPDFTSEYTKLVPEILERVQSLYGKKAKKWEFNEICYEPDGPYLSYPESNTSAYPIEFKVNITLQSGAKSNYDEGIFQISHEVIHLLSPTGDNETNNLEEGLAVYFSKIYTEEKTNNLKIFHTPTPFTGYLYAYNMVSELLIGDKDAVLKVRTIKKKFDKIKKKHFKKAEVVADKNLIKGLLERFERIRPGEDKPDENAR